MAFEALTIAETDAKSPTDDRLLEKIRLNFDDLNSRVIVAGTAPFSYEVSGRLQYITGQKRSIGMVVLNEEFTPSQCRYSLKLSGTAGNLAFDIRKATSPRTPVMEIAHQYNAATQSIARLGATTATQSVARAATQVSTQSITYAKAALNIQAVSLIGTNQALYTLASALDADHAIGDSILVAGCSNANNNGTFTIVEIGYGGGDNFLVTNALAVPQTSAAGTAQSKIMSYNFTNPVDTLFTAGYSHLFASHSTGANNGTLAVYAINQSGNNIWVKNASGATQAGVAGSVDTNLWKFGFTAAAPADLVIGETVTTASHSSGGNNASALPIVGLNVGGNNVMLYNTAGVAQGGVAGTVISNRWKYNMPSDPTAQVSVGHTIYTASHSTAANNGTFTVVDVAAGYIAVYNSTGVAQGGVAGNVYTTRKLVKFASDQSANYTTDSYIEMAKCYSSLYNYRTDYTPHRVVEVNRGGGANYNVVIDITDAGRVAAAAQTYPGGYVQTELKSIFTVAPSLASDLTGLEPNQNIHGVTVPIAAAIPAQTPLLLFITEYPSGDPRDLTVSIR